MAHYYCVPRDNIPDTKNTVAFENCSENYPIKQDHDKERPRDALSVLTCVKPSKVSTLLPRKSSTVKVLTGARSLLLVRATIS